MTAGTSKEPGVESTTNPQTNIMSMMFSVQMIPTKLSIDKMLKGKRDKMKVQVTINALRYVLETSGKRSENESVNIKIILTVAPYKSIEKIVVTI